MSRRTQDSVRFKHRLRLQGFHLLWLRFPSNSADMFSTLHGPTTPCFHGLGFFPFARRYLGNHILFSFPPATEMFQFAGFLLFSE